MLEIGNTSEMNQSILLPLAPAQIGPSSISTTTVNAQHISGNVGACTNLQELALSLPAPLTIIQDNILPSQATLHDHRLPSMHEPSQVVRKSTRFTWFICRK